MPVFLQRHRFSHWPNAAVPLVAAGVYAIWDGATLIYCGMSGRGLQQALERSKPIFGLVTRLASHATGRLSGDQFCVYVANRLVIPTLTPAQLPKFSTGELKLDTLTKAYIHQRFEYQYAIVATEGEAFALERECRAGSYFGMKPSLNPI